MNVKRGTRMNRNIGRIFVLIVSFIATSAVLAEDPWKHGYYTVSDGTKLHYVEMGKGTPVILIHGAGGSAVGNWFSNGIAAAIADTNRVIGIDMRGHALSEAGPPNGRGKMAQDVLEFMQQQKIEKAHIGGYSMGGGVTLSLLTTNPEKFITAHFGGSGIGEVGEWREKVPKDKEGEAPQEKKARAEYYRIQEERAAMRGTEIGNNARDIARLRQNQPERSEAEVAREREAMAMRRDEQLAAIDLTKVTVPVLAVNGDYDRPYARTHRMWRELNNFTNVILPDYGHLSAVMPGFVPKEYTDSLARFIKSNNPK
jgi:pimeloyl-ACP methyl ester carboxylesterase